MTNYDLMDDVREVRLYFQLHFYNSIHFIIITSIKYDYCANIRNLVWERWSNVIVTVRRSVHWRVYCSSPEGAKCPRAITINVPVHTSLYSN